MLGWFNLPAIPFSFHALHVDAFPALIRGRLSTKDGNWFKLSPPCCQQYDYPKVPGRVVKGKLISIPRLHAISARGRVWLSQPGAQHHLGWCRMQEVGLPLSALGMWVVSHSSEVLGSNSLLVTKGLYPLHS